jgi:DNA-directed RNA polymerase specialized sigma24 family protein
MKEAPRKPPDPVAVWKEAFHHALRWKIDEADAKEIADTVMDRFRKAQRTQPMFLADPGELTLFAFRAVKNLVRNLIRDKKPLVSLDMPEVALVSSGADWQRLGDEVEEPDPRVAFIYGKVERLSARCREIWYLMMHDHLKTGQIALLLGIGLRTANTHVYRTNCKMKEARAEWERDHPPENKP